MVVSTKPSEIRVGVRILYLAIHTLTTAVTAGVIIGFGQLYPLLISDKVYIDLCPSGTDPSKGCSDQSVAIFNMFNIGASISTFVQGPSGFALDAFGPKITALIGLAMLIPGSLLFAFSSSTFNGYMAGFVLMSAGGPWSFVSIMPSANLFMRHQAVLMMMFNGAYGCGAFVFFAFSLLYNSAGLSLKVLFIAYAVLCGFLAVLVVIMWPMRKFEEEAVEGDDGVVIVPGDGHRMSEKTRSMPEFVKDIMRDTLNIHFIWLLLCISVCVLGANFYLSTAYNQNLIIAPNDEDLIDKFNIAYGVILPLLGFVGGTPLGAVMDHYGLNVGALLLLCLSSICSIMGVIYNLPLQMVRYCVFSVYFPFIFGVWATFVAKRWGFRDYGTLFGIIAIAAGCVNFVATPLDRVTVYSFFWVNIGFLIVNFLFMFYPAINLARELSKRGASSGEEKVLLINPSSVK